MNIPKLLSLELEEVYNKLGYTTAVNDSKVWNVVYFGRNKIDYIYWGLRILKNICNISKKKLGKDIVTNLQKKFYNVS